MNICSYLGLSCFPEILWRLQQQSQHCDERQQSQIMSVLELNKRLMALYFSSCFLSCATFQ